LSRNPFGAIPDGMNLTRLAETRATGTAKELLSRLPNTMLLT